MIRQGELKNGEFEARKNGIVEKIKELEFVSQEKKDLLSIDGTCYLIKIEEI